MSQLTIDGREVDLAFGPRRSTAALSPAQMAVLRMIGDRGVIRSVEAGVIVHAHRGSCGFGGKDSHRTLRRRVGKIECCRYAATDGLAALRRLERRGLVRRTFLRGRWIAA